MARHAIKPVTALPNFKNAAAMSQPILPKPASPSLTVLYDKSCPLCRKEVAVYQGLHATVPIEWSDVSDATIPLDAATRNKLMVRFHVRLSDGTLLDGAAAFVALWATLPGWRWLARLAKLPGMTALMELAYRFLLLLRPSIQKVARAFERNATKR